MATAELPGELKMEDVPFTVVVYNGDVQNKQHILRQVGVPADHRRRLRGNGRHRRAGRRSVYGQTDRADTRHRLPVWLSQGNHPH